MRLTWILLLLTTLLGLSGPAGAAYHPPIDSQPLPNGALVRVNRRTVLVLRGGNGGASPLVRAELIAARLGGAVEAGLVPGAVLVRRVERQLAVFAGATELVRPTVADAHAAGTTPQRLAYRWAAAVREALALAPLTVSARSVLVPYGEARVVRVGGVAAGPLTLTPRDPVVASAEATGNGRSVRLRAGNPGQTIVAVEADGAMVGIRVVVKKYAGVIGGPVTVDCTGRPAPAELVQQLAMESYSQALRLEPGATVRPVGKPRLPGALEPGRDGWAKVSVRLEGPGMLPREGAVRIHVRCRRLPRREANSLLYSNNPERITRVGRLYVGEVEPNAPCRLLYHHQNMAGRGLWLRIDLINPDGAPVEAQVVEGVSPPMIDTVLVGHRAGVRYMRHSLRDVGRIVSLMPQSRVTLLRQRLAPGYTGSGLFGLRSLSGRRLLVELRAELPTAPELTLPLMEPGTLVEHVYPNPKRVLETNYTVGQNWAFVRMGKTAIPGKHDGQVLYGNYGVLYDISVRIENPLPEPRVVRLILAPDAGGAQGVFLVEGRWIEAPRLTPPAEFELAQFLLSPLERRVVNIRTLPVGGSAYPVTLVVR
jgi:hypothetical protein